MNGALPLEIFVASIEADALVQVAPVVVKLFTTKGAAQAPPETALLLMHEPELLSGQHCAYRVPGQAEPGGS